MTIRGDAAAAEPVEVSALAINVNVPEALQWNDSRRGEEFILSTLNIRLLPDGHVAAKAYGRPVAGGRGGYTSFRVPDRPEPVDLIDAAATRASELWATHQGLQ
ncbi:hypothetical protein JNB_02720 [Janibacter sp. HTCC2649]|uniref:hypothetical protein n=1 Tax=Janibacter sp. HTCC2649 TaxID=313589 RepID=UPI000066EB0A|nr:hypothetical protein [Janibacter sp. HTCC2649]EAP99046.1 hypothetical protein JNB_02720 [Janibacter sp. HTCC2649]